MTFKVIAEAEAKRDWNDLRQPGVGLRFDGAIRTFLQTLANQPDRFRLATRLTRLARMPKPWPYLVYLTINREFREVKVLSIWHCKRNPAELRKRLK